MRTTTSVHFEVVEEKACEISWRGETTRLQTVTVHPSTLRLLASKHKEEKQKDEKETKVGELIAHEVEAVLVVEQA